MQRKQNRGLAQVGATAMRPTNLTTSIVSLEIVLGAIMTFGGIALTFFATEKILGIVHTGLGLLAFPIAYAFWTSRSRAWNAILTLNVASIAYSTFSEIIAANLSLLGPDQLQDSLIGTVVAIMVSILVITLLLLLRKQE